MPGAPVVVVEVGSVTVVSVTGATVLVEVGAGSAMGVGAAGATVGQIAAGVPLSCDHPDQPGLLALALLGQAASVAEWPTSAGWVRIHVWRRGCQPNRRPPLGRYSWG